MNEIIIEELSVELNIKKEQIKAVLNLLSEGATIPFIARYRKEATGALDENEIAKIEEKYRQQNNKQINIIIFTKLIINKQNN